MTPKEITTLAGHRLVPPWVMKLALDVAAAEREACAQVCDWILMDTLLNVSNDYQEGRDMGVVVCAAAIRERSNANARARSKHG